MMNNLHIAYQQSSFIARIKKTTCNQCCLQNSALVFYVFFLETSSMQEIKIAMNYTNLTQDFIQLKTHNLKTTFHDHNTLLD